MKNASVGKRVGRALYVHRSAVSAQPERFVQTLVDADARAGDFDWNVVRIADGDVTFLLYESFEEAAFPALLESLKVARDGSPPVRTDYRRRPNPPILHRKELLLSADHPMLPKFRALTASAEEHGLFADPHKIGTRNAWTDRIREAGLEVRGHALVPAQEERVEVSRHRTAIVRRDLSQPMQIMLRLGVVTPSRSVFDFGCGQGEDVAALASQGYDAFGWDPHHATHGRREPASVVNLGFVLNVIEDAKERAETLKAAWGFAEAALCVSVMVQGCVDTRAQRPHRDGFLTSRGTFQKYFAQQELRELVASATGQTPLSLAPGIVAAFRDKDLEQEVLLRRRSREFAQDGALPRPPVRERLIVSKASILERLAPVMEVLCEQAIFLGRLPEGEEIPSQVQSALADMRVSWGRVSDGLAERLASDERYIESKSRAARRPPCAHGSATVPRFAEVSKPAPLHPGRP